ncbi:MAG: T9SS type A sorting domain-containing protein [Calditrichaeota bacterium]|nr:T9SS type A sorting domain-containing protein [Calditrichota bacterium]
MKFFYSLFLLMLVSFLNAQTFELTDKHRLSEAKRKAEALDRQKDNLILAQSDFRGYDVNYYGLTLDIFPSSYMMHGSVEVKSTVSRDNLSNILLDFSTYLNVDSVKSENQTLNFTHNSAGLNIVLNKNYNTDETVSVSIYYHGRTDFGGNSVFGTSFGHTSVLGKHHLWSLSEPYGARDWWPCKDTPLDKADSMDITYIVPEGMTATSNGILVSETTANGRSTFHWKVSYPMATYLVSIAAYEYARYDDEYISAAGDTLPIMFFVAPQNLNNSKETFMYVNDMIAGFSNLFGEYPFMREKYGHVEASISGGMEHQTLTTLGPIQFNQGFYGLGLISHELAHMWWGDMITCASFQDIWLNEGFATYSEALIQEVFYGKEAYHAQMEFEEYYGAGTIFVEDTTDSNRIFNGYLSYSKGAYFLHMLRGVVGDSTFFDILKAWYNNPKTKYSSAYTADFINVCEEVSGLNLEKFFDQWIYGQYYPVYGYGFKTEKVDEGYKLSLFIDQVQDKTGLFWMPIDIRVTTTDGQKHDFVVWDSLASQQFDIVLESDAVDIELDPDKWILKETRSKLIDPPLDKGVLLVNGLGWRLAGVREAYDARAFWGNAEITFWDLFDAPADGYPESLPAPAGNGPLSLNRLGQYSTVIWVSNKSGGDFEAWKEIPWLDYLNNGGNIIFISKSGQAFITDGLRDYLGITWDENELTLIYDFVSSSPDMIDMNMNSSMAFIGVFDTLLTKQTSKLLFKTVAEQEYTKGVGVISSPADGGDFVYLAARPYQFDNQQLRTNITQILSSYMGVPVSDLAESEKVQIPEKFDISNIYPNPFNPETTINFTLPEASDINLTVFDVLGKKVATLIDNMSYKTGTHKVTWNAGNEASGLYFIQLSDGKSTITRKTILMK